MAIYYITQNDAIVTMLATLKNADGTVIDLSGASAVTFHLGYEGDPDSYLVSGACSIVSATAGRVSYTWTAANTAVLEAGATYDAEFCITWPGGVIRTVPSKAGGFRVVVRGEVK